MDSQPLCGFSRGGEYFTSWSSQGELKVWDTKTVSLHQTLTSSHLRGKTTCLVWSRVKKATKKRQSGLHTSLHIGAGVGSKVIVWNLAKNDEILLEGHNGEVTCMDWDKKKLYSGSKDQHVMEWDIGTGESRKWKADKLGVQCICCYGDGSTLLTAGRSIKLWSLVDYSVVKRVTGHASSINQLAFVSRDSFLSSAGNDRVINYWQSSNDSHTSAATLTCEEAVQGFHSCLDDQDSVAKVAVVTEQGGLFLYQFSLSPLPPSPVVATSSIQYVSSPRKPGTSQPLPVLAVVFSATHSITVAHSSYITPSIETMEFEQADKQTCLIRDIRLGGLLLPQSQHTPSRVQDDRVTILGPGNMTLPTHQLPSLDANQNSDLRPLSDRLEPEARKFKEPVPSADSLTQLLVQSVGSGDGKLMEEVLRVTKERIVIATVKKIPVHVVLPFLRKLIELLQSSPARGLQLSLWIKTVLSSHAAYLMTVPQLAASLSGLHQLLEVRVHTFSRLCQLQGKLELMIAQGAVSDGGLAAAQLALTTPLQTITIAEDDMGTPPTQDSSDEELTSECSDYSDDDSSMASDSSQDASS